MSENILLDSNIRDWVVLPLFVIIVCAGMLRFYVGNYLKPEPKSMSKVSQRTQLTVRSTSALKSGSIHFLSSAKLEARRVSYPQVLADQAEWCEVHLDEKEQAKEEGKATDADDDMANPLAAMDGMKGGMVAMVQNMVMMQGIQHFFSGFILLKVPFQLTAGFKMMFQRGLEGLSTLDTSYVSSVSWYFLVMFGLRGFFRLAIGAPTLETQESQKLLAEFGKRPGGGPPQASANDDAMIKQLKQEAENLPIHLPKQFKSNLDGVEKRLLKNKYPKKKSTLGKGDDFLLHAANESKKNK